MSWHPRRRIVPVAFALVALLAFSGVALAYWTATGGGIGTAQAAAATSPLVVKQVTAVNNLYPGGPAQTISGKFDNLNSGPVYVTTVTASISSVTKAAGAPSGNCVAADFTLSPTTATVNAEVPAGTDQGGWTGPAIKLNDTGANQDGCKGATVNLSYSIP